MPGDWRGRWRRVLLLVLIDRAHRGLEIAFEDESISYGFQLYSFLLVHHQLKAIPIYYSGTTLLHYSYKIVLFILKPIQYGIFAVYFHVLSWSDYCCSSTVEVSAQYIQYEE